MLIPKTQQGRYSTDRDRFAIAADDMMLTVTMMRTMTMMVMIMMKRTKMIWLVGDEAAVGNDDHDDDDDADIESHDLPRTSSPTRIHNRK